MNPPVFDPNWSKELLALYQHDMQEIWDQSIAVQIWNQYHNQLDLYLSLAQLKTPLDILDVGCAQGTLALKLAEAGHRVIAVDIRQAFLDYAATRYEYGNVSFVCGNVLDLELDRSFDLIFANQIVEHLVYPLDMVKRLKILLNPGGRLVITTPNGQYVMNKLPFFTELGDPAQWENKQFTADGDGHFFAYHADELKQIFFEAGFKNVTINFFETPWISGHMKLRYLHHLFPGAVLGTLDRFFLKLPVIARHMAHQLLVIGNAG